MPQPAAKSGLSSDSPSIKNPKHAGRKPIDIDRAKLSELIEIGCKTNEIAQFFGCAEETLTRKFASLFRQKREEVKAELRKKQLELARAGDRTMLIWLGKNMIGQTDRADVTSGGEALKVIVERIG